MLGEKRGEGRDVFDSCQAIEEEKERRGRKKGITPHKTILLSPARGKEKGKKSPKHLPYLVGLIEEGRGKVVRPKRR